MSSHPVVVEIEPPGGGAVAVEVAVVGELTTGAGAVEVAVAGELTTGSGTGQVAVAGELTPGSGTSEAELSSSSPSPPLHLRFRFPSLEAVPRKPGAIGSTTC